MSAVCYDVVIIGGGAAGLAAAITYQKREPHGRLLLAEANDICGKKILATGNGRCNISNLSADGYQGIKDFFGSVGVLFRIEDGGRAYPMSGQAASVTDALMCAIQRLCVEVRYGARAVRLEKGMSGDAGEEGFTVWFEDGSSARAGSLLIATGGKAGPQYGCRGEGYAFARSLGHGVESIRPALVPLMYADREKERLAGLKGVRIRSRAELYVNGRRAGASEGELQFTEYGLSGIMIFDLSLAMPKSILEGRPRTEVAIDFAPGEEASSLERLIRENEGLWLSGVAGRKLSELLVREAGEDAVRISGLAKNFVVQVGGTKGWKEAQATLGGVLASEVNGQTGESLLCKGLFFAGEVLEPVFACGGFNLSHAWSTGIRAGWHL